jgi:outer membrane protein OmpA-like peptidoglycan-associated protein
LDSVKPSAKGAFEFVQVSGTYQVQFKSGDFKSTSKNFAIPSDYPQDNYLLTPEILGVSDDYIAYRTSKNNENKIARTENNTNSKEKALVNSNKAGVISNILFLFDDYKLSNESEQEVQNLIAIMKENPSIEIEVLGFTDSEGKDGYNNRLSKKRAKNIRDKLIDAGISSGRVAFKGMGKSNPIAINENPDGSDNPAGRAFNRRVEFCLIKCDNKNITVKRIVVPENLKVK